MGALAEKFNDLDPRSIKAIVAYAIELIRANEWNHDWAQMLTQQASIWHGEEGVDAFAEAVGKEFEKHPSV